MAKATPTKRTTPTKSATKKSAVRKKPAKKKSVAKQKTADKKKPATKKSAPRKVSVAKKKTTATKTTTKTTARATNTKAESTAQSRARHERTSRLLVKTGRTLIVIGFVIGGFLAYQLWGTGRYQHQAQSNLKKEFTSTTVAGSPSSVSSSTTLPSGIIQDLYVPGGTVKTQATPIARLEIPAIGVDQFVVTGVSWKALMKGPGLYPHSPLPGQAGNASIAGHRTTFGSPFLRIDELKPGDEIRVETKQGNFTYKVAWTKIIRPNNMTVLANDPKVKSSLTLISCHPKFSSDKRIVVRANIAPNSAAAVKPATPITILASEADAKFSLGWFHDKGGIAPTLWWGLLVFVLYQLPWFIRRRRHTEFALGVSAFACLVLVFPALWLFYESLARLVPTSL